MERRVQSVVFLGELTGHWPRHQEALGSVTRVMEHQACHWTGPGGEFSGKEGLAHVKVGRRAGSHCGAGICGSHLDCIWTFSRRAGHPHLPPVPITGLCTQAWRGSGGLHPTAGTTENSQTEGTCLGNIHLPLSGCLDFEKTFYIYHELQFF